MTINVDFHVTISSDTLENPPSPPTPHTHTYRFNVVR